MNVSDAVVARRSIRAFLPTPVPTDTIVDLLKKASRSPSGGNLQPWNVHIINGQAMERFRAHVAASDFQKEAEYEVYPPELHEPYRTSRFRVGEEMYELLGIARDDKPARLMRMAENFNFFGAPSAFFCFVDKRMGYPQWSDLGMFLQTFMLLASEAGLSTCAQEAWANRSEPVREFVNAPDNHMMFCGMAIGHADPDAPVNTLVSNRRPFEEWATVVE